MPRRKDDEDDLITVQEGAQLKGVSRARVHQWIKAGRLKTEKKYGRVLIRRRELMALESLRRGRPRRTSS